jgi:GTP-binding protein
VERTTVLLHIIDISDETGGGAWQKFEAINRELALFSPTMMEKLQIVAVNKIDLPDTREKLQNEIDIFKKKELKLLSFSAITGEGVQEIVNAIIEKLQTAKTS